MMWNKQNIFEPSGCLSREAFSAFLENELPADVQAVADEHIGSCPFCSDAAEGFHVVSKKEATELMASTDKLFAQKLFSSKKERRKKIIWVALSAAATILLLIGVFTVINHERPQISQLADNAAPAETVAPLEKSQTDKPEPKKQVAPLNAKDKSAVYNGLNNSEATQDQLSEPEIRSEMIAGDISETASVRETESKKKEVSSTFAPIAAAENVQDDKPKLASKSAAYNEETSYESQDEYSPAAASGTRRSNFIIKKSGTFKEEKSEQVNVEPEHDTLIHVNDELPTFQGGDLKRFRKYVQNQIKYPESFSKDKISGRVLVQFAIEVNGKVADINILQGLRPDIDNEVIRVLKNSPSWKQTEKPVKQQFTMQLYIK